MKTLAEKRENRETCSKCGRDILVLDPWYNESDVKEHINRALKNILFGFDNKGDIDWIKYYFKEEFGDLIDQHVESNDSSGELVE